MRSKQLVLGHYDTDKVPFNLMERYDPILAPWVDKEIKLLEIGVYRGGSLLLWRDYFPQGTIVGIDINPPQNIEFGERIHLLKGSQTDTKFLTDVTKKIAPEGFDIIIDDASHIGELTKITFWHLFDNHLKPGGLYAIEDWGTGYFDDWPDGKSFKGSPHNYGMVGFIKELVDEQGAANLTKKRLDGKMKRVSKFESLLITPSVVFVRKTFS